MNRAEFVVALAIAATTGAAASVSADIDVKREADDLLAPFTVSIAVRNPSSHIIGIDFPTAEMYRIDVRHDDRILWSTATGHKPLSIARRIDVAPGVTRLASQIVDGTTDDRRAYPPGDAIVHVALLGTTLNTRIDKPVSFAEPMSIADALRTTGGRVVTIAGEPTTDAGRTDVRDASGTIRLSRPLGIRPTGKYVIRGFLDAVGDDVEFAVGRFAPAYDNLGAAKPIPPA